ncbi:MAG: hypothetical protein K0S33_1736 [Bacteroidetes bacterium]|jgi:hypothetical protein|nr:hypothetical protein [Bacteroidota bacterium]
MIDIALQAVAVELNEFFRIKFGIQENRVVVSNLVNQDGSQAVKDENRIILSMVMIQEEKTGSYKNAGSIPPGGVKPVYLNLYLLFSASFNEKLNTEALKFISAVIAFFQSKPVFTSQNTANLGAGLEKLTFEISNLTVQEQSNLWSTLGAKYMPSVLYKVRVVTIDQQMLVPDVIDVGGMDNNYNQ